MRSHTGADKHIFRYILLCMHSCAVVDAGCNVSCTHTQQAQAHPCCCIAYIVLLNRLSTELDMIHEKKVIVFVNTKRQCDNVYAQLEDAGYSCTVLHGGRTQDQREVGGTEL